MPDIEGRKAILKVHARGKPFAKSVNWEQVAKQTVGFSGRIWKTCLMRRYFGGAEGKKEIQMADIEEAATKVKLGPSASVCSQKRKRNGRLS